jgi:hypothetical protein
LVAALSTTLSGMLNRLGALDAEVATKLPITGEAASVATISGLITPGLNITITGLGTAASPYNLAAAGGGGATNLGYTAATRELTSSTGTEVILPLVASADAGLAPASGGGAKNFLRADGTWVAPPFMTDAAVKLPAGMFTAAHTSGAALGTVAQVANRNTIAPFRPQYDMTIDQVGVSTSTGVAATTAKVVIYDADPATGLPTTLIAESGTISTATSGTTNMVALSVSFEAGKTYWIGARASGTQTLRSILAAGLPMLSMSNAGTPIMRGSLVKLETYADPAAAWGFLTSQMSNTTVPLVLMRIA